MSLPIFYTPRAQETLILVHDFISQKFGAKAATKFVLKSERTIALIAQHPYLFKSSYFDINIRVAPITKRTSLFYRVTATAIHLLFFWIIGRNPFCHQISFNKKAFQTKSEGFRKKNSQDINSSAYPSAS